MLPRELMSEIVRLVAKGMADRAEAKLSAIRIRPFSEASKFTRDAANGIMGYVMSLAPVRAVSTSTLLGRMMHRDFAAEVVATAEMQGSALMPRIADLAADPKGARVADALRGKLIASIRGATVNGERMYGDDDAIERSTDEIIARLKIEQKFEEPDGIKGIHNGLECFTRRFVSLSVPERMKHMLKYGPMCIWDVRHATSFDFACTVYKGEAPFHSDLFWDTSDGTSMSGMFLNNGEFRGDLSTWDVSKITAMNKMFQQSGIEDSGIGIWDVSSLESAHHMFTNAMSLRDTLDLSRWNMRSCKNASSMFSSSSITDNKIGTWTLHPNARTHTMFEGAKFRGDLSRWLPGHRDNALIGAIGVSPAVAQPSFGAVEAQRSDHQAIRDIFADALSAQEKEQEASSCAVQ